MIKNIILLFAPKEETEMSAEIDQVATKMEVDQPRAEISRERSMISKFFFYSISGGMKENFHYTKALSDYVGMIARLIFMAALFNFVYSRSYFSGPDFWTYDNFTLLVLLTGLGILNIIFLMSFGFLNQSILKEIFLPNWKSGRSTSRTGRLAEAVSFILMAMIYSALQHQVQAIVRAIAKQHGIE